ncbi:MAG: HD domain-containing protein [Christensenellaceae bacterium]|nr:HD domain-containing protein [Christensenellaceae bacterium]
MCEIIDGVMTPLSDNAVKGETVLGIGVDPYRRLWCVLNSGDYVVLQYGECVAMLDITSFSPVNAKLTCVTTDISRNVYIGTTGREFFKIEFTNEELTRSGYSVTTYDSQDALNHNRISVMENGDMLVSSQQGFAWVKPNGESVNLHTQKTMGGVNSSIIDYEGNVWLASSNEGLIRYVPGYFSSPNITAGLTGVDVNAVTSAGGLFYVGTNNGLLAFDESWNPVSNAISEKLKTAHIQNLMTDSNGLLWCGTYSEFGVVRYNSSTGEIKVFNVENGIESENVRVSLELSDGTIAVGTQDGIAFIRGDAVISFLDKDNGLKTHSILSLAEAPNGSLLAGSAGSGIYAIRKGGEVASFGEEQGLEDGVVLRIVPDSKEHCFVSAGSSLYYWQGGVFTKLENLKIGVGSIYDIVERDGRLWLMQDGGIYSVNKARLLSGERVHATKYGIGNGLTGSLNVNNWNYLSPEGNIYIATRNGVSVFDFRAISSNTPKLVINNITVDGVTYEKPTKLTLNSSAKRMTVSFSALSFSGAEDFRIAYRLIGFITKETVIEDGVSGTVSYTNLAGGDYTLRLRVFNPEDPDSQKVLEINIVKEKGIKEQPLFWIAINFAIVLIVFGISYFAIQAKSKREGKRKQMYRKIVGQALRTFANTIEAKDSYTNVHSIRVALYSKEITRRMGKSVDDQETVYYIALLHDIGKIAVPDEILNKKGKLTTEEMEIINTHTKKGGDILKDFTALKMISDGARYHHERYDGTGYCEGLKGTEIPLTARIICVADCYDAMSVDRCYRKALPREKILEEFEKGSGTQFDPDIAAIMIQMIKEGVVPIETPSVAISMDESAITPPPTGIPRKK